MDNLAVAALSLATAMQRSLDITANNLANLNTTGYKAERVVFDSFVHVSDVTGVETRLLVDSGSYVDTTVGGFVQTDNPLDTALEGKGWYSYLTPEGETTFGRDGRFTLDQRGELVTVSGDRVLDQGGAPIAIPPELAGEVTITDTGAITTVQAGVIATLGVFEIRDIQGFERIGQGKLLAPPGFAPQALAIDLNTRVAQGAIEGSNVEAMTEMTRLMEIHRSYDRAVRIIQEDDDLRKQMLSRLGQSA